MITTERGKISFLQWSDTGCINCARTDLKKRVLDQHEINSTVLLHVLLLDYSSVVFFVCLLACLDDVLFIYLLVLVSIHCCILFLRFFAFVYFLRKNLKLGG